MNHERRIGDDAPLSEAGLRRKREILDSLGSELDRSVRRRKALRVCASGGGLAVCGVALAVALRVMVASPGVLPSPPAPIAAVDPVPAPSPVEATAAARGLAGGSAGGLTMRSARFEVVQHRPELARAWRMSDEELVSLVAETGRSASIIRVLEGSERRAIVIDNRSGLPFAAGEGEAAPEPAGNRPEVESQKSRRAV